MKSVILLGLLSIISPAIHAVEVQYPNQAEIPNLECSISGDASEKFVLRAPKMIWQEKVNAKFPGYNLYVGETVHYGLIKITVQFTDSSEGKSAQVMVRGAGNTNFENTSSINVANFLDTFFSLSLITTDENPITYAVRCVVKE